MILAVNVVAKGTGSLGVQSTVPMLSCTGSIEMRWSVHAVPEAAHSTLLSSTSIAIVGQRISMKHRGEREIRLTFDDSALVSWQSPKSFSHLDDTAADPTNYRNACALPLKYIRNRDTKRGCNIS